MSHQKIIVITGANSGIGKVTATQLAMNGDTVVMVCRDQLRGEQALLEVKQNSKNDHVYLMLCDLSSFQSVVQFCQLFKTRFGKIDVLVNNAGVMMRERKITQDGYEFHFQVNYLSQVLITNLLVDMIKPSGRIINVSSLAHRMGNIYFSDLNLEQRFSMFRAYSQSKLAFILFTYELAERLKEKQITVNCLHPGVIISNLGIYKERKIIDVLTNKLKGLFSSVEKGAETSIYLASSNEVSNITGKYFYHKKIRKSSKKSYDKVLSKRLWEYTETLLNQFIETDISA